MVLNAAARLAVDAGKYEHIKPVLRGVLHWLPVRQRILYKLAVTSPPLPNVAICWFLGPELSSTDGVKVSTLQLAWNSLPAWLRSLPLLVVDNSEMGLKLICSCKLAYDSLRTLVFRMNVWFMSFVFLELCVFGDSPFVCVLSIDLLCSFIWQMANKLMMMIRGYLLTYLLTC